MAEKIFGVIGNGKMAVDCIKYMQKYEDAKIAFFIYDPKKDNPSDSIMKTFEDAGINVKGITKINSPEAVEFVKRHKPDIMFSINNYRIIKDDLIAIPKTGTINFHNAPLPLYGGVNIPSWVIINGEKEHGVTWHFIDLGIDTGDVIAQRKFPIDEDTTAGRLMSLSIMEGLALFKETFENILHDNYKRQPQSGMSSYYSLKDYPENNGILSFSWNYEKIDQMVRGLNFIPFENTFVYPKLKTGNGEVVVNMVSYVGPNDDHSTVGKIMKIDDETFQIACADAILNIEDVMTEEMEGIEINEIAKTLGVREGDILD